MPDQSVDPWEPLRSELAADVRRVADRLRSMSQARLAGAPAPSEQGLPSYGSRAEAARVTAGSRAAAAATLEAAVTADRPQRRAMPELSDFAAGDQVAVAGHDLLAALDAAPPLEKLRAVATGAHAELVDLRSRL